MEVFITACKIATLNSYTVRIKELIYQYAVNLELKHCCERAALSKLDYAPRQYESSFSKYKREVVYSKGAGQNMSVPT